MTTTNNTAGADTRHDEPRTLTVPRRHEIGGVSFFINRTGSLTLGERTGNRPVVRITPQEAHALLTFLRLPGVAELIEQEEAARQDRFWRDYEEEPEHSGEWQAT